ncbi:MAG TPA: GC-type dockerin domain-anchored protein [Phycisphaerales bacterium]|nr:GC-type dockerin domain-anchored protein [Phycisphaerales bacterium]
MSGMLAYFDVRSARVIAATALCTAASVASAQSFQDGDIYLVSAALPGGAGVMRIDPSDWSKTQIYSGSAASFGRACYDQFRDRLVCFTDGANPGLLLLGSDGSKSYLVYSGTQDVSHVTSAGDGRIYYARASNGSFGYFDGANQRHTLFEADGVTPALPQFPVRAVHLVTDTASGDEYLLATYFTGTAARIDRMRLSADGTRVTEHNHIDFLVNEGAVVVGMNPGPSGKVFVKIDNNSNDALARMLLLDVEAMSISTFAVSSYAGVAGEIAGCYSHASSRAVVIDSLSDNLRVFSFGESGPGSIVNTGVSSPGGSGESAQLIDIVLSTCPADFDGSGFVDTDDFTAFVVAFENGDDSADFDGTGFVDTDDFTAFVLAFEGGC